MQFDGHMAHSPSGLRVEDLVEVDDPAKEAENIEEKKKRQASSFRLTLTFLFSP